MKLKRILLTALLLTLLACAALADETVYFHQIDIGCANAYLITRGETVILVDCGLDTDNLLPEDNHVLFDYLAASGIDHVDAYIVTHYHNDHAYNVVELMRLYGTADTVVYGPSKLWPQKRFGALPTGVYRQMKLGDTAAADGIGMLCVGPYRVQNEGFINSDSLNVVLTCSGRRFVITGDYMNDRAISVFPQELKDVDVLAFPHHGLKPLAISTNSMRHMNPKIVVVPGRNNLHEFLNKKVYQFPQVYTTADGNIVVETNGEDLTVHTRVKPGEYPFALHGTDEV